MKIYEIISESNQVDEGIASALGKGLSWAGSKLASSDITKRAVSDLAAEYAKRAMAIQRAGKSVPPVSAKFIKNNAPTDAKRLLSDPKYIALIQKEADKIMRNSHLSTIAGKAGLSNLVKGSKWDITKAVGSKLVKLYSTWQVIGMFRDYNSNVNAWDAELQKQLAAGKITQEQYQAQLDHIRKTEMGLLVTKVGAGLLGSAIVRGTVAPIAGLFKLIPLTAPIGSIISGLGAAGSAYLYTKLNSKEGSEAVASVMVGNALGDAATSAIGGTVTNAIDWLTGTAKEAAAADKQPAQGGQGASQTPVNAPGQQPAKPAAQPAAAPTAPTMPGNNKTATADLYTPAGYTRDAAGNLIYGN